MRNPREVFIEYRERFKALYTAREHIHFELVGMGVDQRGHGFFEHDHPVAQTCLLLHEDEKAVRMAWLASMLHSLDRFMSENEENEAVDGLLSLVPESEISSSEITEIKVALRNHDGPNGEFDSLTQVILQDADRLANAMAIVIPRSAQFFPKVPVAELGYLGFEQNPASTFKKPSTVHDNLLSILEWDTEGPQADKKFCLRLPRAIEFGRPHFKYLRGWIRKNQADFKALGLDPWPIE